MASNDSSPVRTITTLGIAGLLSGIILVSIFLVTKPVIAANRAEALKEAIYKVLPGAEAFTPYVMEGDSLAPHEGDDLPEEEAVYLGRDGEGGVIGWAIVAEGSGFQDVIKLIYGYDPDAEQVVGMEVLESRETPGLGDKIFKDQDFVDEFKGLAVEPEIVAVKDESDAPNEVDAITGATISSDAVVDIINKGNERWLDKLPEAPPREEMP
ncbi:MAG: FMN-binding protein [Myxococcota bacterium]